MKFFENIITTHNSRDILAAMPDAISMHLGLRTPVPHPFADCIAESPLRAGAFAAGIVAKGFVSGEEQRATITRGLRTQEFAQALAAGLQADARRRFDQQARHRQATSEVELPRIGIPVELGEVNFNAALTDVTSHSEYSDSRARLAGGESLTLRSYGRIVACPRELIFNDDSALIAAAVNDTGLVAARHEAKLVADALVANPNLSDGQPVFHANYMNIVATALGEPGFGECLAALRNQPDREGLALDHAAAILLVAANLEAAAAKLVHDVGLPITVVAMAALPTGRYYLLADRTLARTIAAAKLAGSNHPLAVEAGKLDLKFDGLRIKVRVDLGAGLIGRLGIIRGGA